MNIRRMKGEAILAVLGIVAVVGLSLSWRFLWVKGFGEVPEPRHFPTPEVTEWKPSGPRMVESHHPAFPDHDAFHTMHVGLNNTDEMYSVIAPMVEQDWTAEPNLYIPEGPTYDNEGNLYFSPMPNKEGLSLVSLDVETGKRNWVIKAESGGGAPLVLNDVENPGKQIIYHCARDRAWAIRPSGEIIWETKSGLSLPEDKSTKTHCWGMNYISKYDVLTGVTIDAHVYLMDRKTGALLTEKPFRLPGKIAPKAKQLPSKFLLDKVDATMARVFDNDKLFTGMINVIYGGDFQVSNFYGSDPNTGRLYVAATAPDGDDGKEDGVSEYGAIYALEVRKSAAGKFSLEVLSHKSFAGGTGSTPSISYDANRVLISDSSDLIIAMDLDLNELWRIQMEDQIAASVAIASDNNELYAVSKDSIYKLYDRGDHGELAWKADLDMFPEAPFFENYQNLTPTITANGLAVALAGGYEINNKGLKLPTRMGVGVVDRATGKVRSFSLGTEESIAVTSVGHDGGYYLANSPVRHAVTKTLFPELAGTLNGGVTRYKPIRQDLVVRDAACAADTRVINTLKYPQSMAQDIRQLNVLSRQIMHALDEAVAEGSMDVGKSAVIAENITAVMSGLSESTFADAGKSFGEVCSMLKQG